jgi:hypothetical protein
MPSGGQDIDHNPTYGFAKLLGEKAVSVNNDLLLQPWSRRPRS